MAIEMPNLIKAMEDIERELITVDAVIRRNGYTQVAKDMMVGLLASVREIQKSAHGELRTLAEVQAHVKQYHTECSCDACAAFNGKR